MVMFKSERREKARSKKRPVHGKSVFLLRDMLARPKKNKRSS